MSGKADGKRRNRAAQSEPHGYQEYPEERAGKPVGRKGRGAPGNEKQRLADKLRLLEERRRQETGKTSEE